MVNTWPGWENAGLIGEGSFGRVYRIKREEFGIVYEAALKVVTIPGSQADVRAAYDEGMDGESVTRYFYSFVEDVVAEFALLAQLKGNSNIVSYEDHMVVQREDEIGWDILIRMELLTALPQYTAEHPLEEADVVRLGKDMARALELCRKRGIIHRDVKPENIFVSKDGDFKLGDFGVARVAEKTMSAMSKKGTYNYMAPEVYRGQEYGYGADLYSLGLVLYRFLNDNRMPFLPPYPETIRYKDKENALSDRMRGLEVPPPAHGSDALRQVVLKACAFRPEDRYRDAGEFREALQALERLRKDRQVIEAAGRFQQGQQAVDEAEESQQVKNQQSQAAAEDGSGTDEEGTVGWGESRHSAGKAAHAKPGGKDGVDASAAFSGEGETDSKGTGRKEESASPEEDAWDKTISTFAGRKKSAPANAGKRPWYQNRLIGALALPLCVLIQCLFPADPAHSPADIVFVVLHHSTEYYYANAHSGDSSGAMQNIHSFALSLCLFSIAAGMALLWGKIWQEKSPKRRMAAQVGFVLAWIMLFWIRGTIWIMMTSDAEQEFSLLAATVMFGINLFLRYRKGRKGKAAVGETAAVWLFMYSGFMVLSLLTAISIPASA